MSAAATAPLACRELVRMGARQERGTQGQVRAGQCEQTTWPELPRDSPSLWHLSCTVTFCDQQRRRRRCHRFPELRSPASPSPLAPAAPSPCPGSEVGRQLGHAVLPTNPCAPAMPCDRHCPFCHRLSGTAAQQFALGHSQGLSLHFPCVLSTCATAVQSTPLPGGAPSPPKTSPNLQRRCQLQLWQHRSPA